MLLSKRLQDVSCIVCFGRSIYYNINMIQELNYEELSRNNNITVKKGVP